MEEQKRESWIKIFRGIENSWLWKEKPFSRGQAWIDLLLLAKYMDEKFFDRRGNIVDGKRGHVYLSIRNLAERWGWSRCKADRFLNLLQSEDMIKIEKKQASEKTAIFIVNYDKYQKRQTSEKANESTSERPVENGKNEAKPLYPTKAGEKTPKNQTSEKTGKFLGNYDKNEDLSTSKKASEQPVSDQSKTSERPVSDISKKDKEGKESKEIKEEPSALPSESLESEAKGEDDEDDTKWIDFGKLTDEEFEKVLKDGHL